MSPSVAPRAMRRQGVTLRMPPLVGMRDSRDPSTSARNKAVRLENVYIRDPSQGNDITGRPGTQQLGEILPAPIQCLYQFTRLDRTEYSIAVAGGSAYRYDWFAHEWIQIEGLEFSTIGKVYAVTLADQVIFSDGVNRPVSWDGETVTVLSDCPVLYGPPTVHYAKLFGIVASDPITIVWSEENDPTRGYDTGGFNNAWRLGQTDQERLYAIRGTNEALYYWRARSIGAIAGAVTVDFSTTGTQEAISLSTGTVSPDAIAQYEQSFFFLDADGRPQLLLIGGGVQTNPEIWRDAAETTQRVPITTLGNAAAVLEVGLGLVLYAITPAGSTENDLIVAYHALTAQFAGVWTGLSPYVLGRFKDEAGREIGVGGSIRGIVRMRGLAEGSVWDDDGVPIRHYVDGPYMSYDPQAEISITRADLVFDSNHQMTGVAFRYHTAQGTSGSRIFDVAKGAAGMSYFDEARFDQDTFSNEIYDWHVSVGLNGMGRWVRPVIEHQQLGERFGLFDLMLDAVHRGKKPTAR